MKKKYAQEKTYLMCLLLAVNPVVSHLDCNCYAIAAGQERTAIQTQVGKGRTNRSTAVQITCARARDILAFYQEE